MLGWLCQSWTSGSPRHGSTHNAIFVKLISNKSIYFNDDIGFFIGQFFRD